MKKSRKRIWIAAVSLLAAIGVAGMSAEAGESRKYVDVSPGGWYVEYVDYVSEKGYMTGLNETTFGVNDNLARAHFALMLYRLEGEPAVEYIDKFPDVKEDEWYTDAIIWANQQGIVTGYSNGMFGVGDNITREQMATMMYRYADYKGFDVSKQYEGSYPDMGMITDFAYNSMRWSFGEGIISGDNGYANPQGIVIRAVAATMLTRLDRNVMMEDLENGYLYIKNQKVHFDFPESWQGKFEVWYTPTGITFYCKPLCEIVDGKFYYAGIASVSPSTDPDRQPDWVFEKMGEKDGLYYYGQHVGDVTFDGPNLEKEEIYHSVDKDWDVVRDSMTFVD